MEVEFLVEGPLAYVLKRCDALHPTRLCVALTGLEKNFMILDFKIEELNIE